VTAELNTRAPRGPVRGDERALAPDLARGTMLLVIALANCAGAVFGTAPGVDPTPHGLERVYNVLMFAFVHARGMPMFAIMFGYGLVQLARRQEASGSSPGAVRAVLLRRNGWLTAFGAVHGILFYSGDILGAYGLMGIVFTLVLLRRGDRVHRIAPWLLGATAGYTLVLAGLAGWGMAHGSNERAPVPTVGGEGDSLLAQSYAASVLDRLAEWPIFTLTVSGLISIVWLGAWAARRRLLEEPQNHRRLLRRVAVGGIGIAVVGSLPMGLLSAGVLRVDTTTAGSIKRLYEVSGTFGGAGYIALFGLLALALTRANPAPRSNLVVGALSALGQRSLSGYLFQSVAWLLLISPFTFALGTRFSSPTFAAAGCAVAVWLTTLAGAYLMDRHSYRGPAEILLRRLVYGPRPRSVSSDHDRMAGTGSAPSRRG
jgi:uncharacterized protein